MDVAPPVSYATAGIVIIKVICVYLLQLSYIALKMRLKIMSGLTTTSWRQNFSVTISMLSVSADGYIRLSFAKLQSLTLVHLISGLDENSTASIYSGAIPTEITGYTEWVNTTTPAITIGWDWQMHADQDRTLLHRISAPRSNLMLQDSLGIDVGPAKTTVILEALVNELDWSNIVRNHIGLRYRV
ncbi:MAG: DUF4902 domain-containing protein [Sulfuriferula sp.]